MNIPIWPGSSSFHPGDTPFGFYDKDPAFEKDADKVCTFVTRRLGYPLVEIELQAINIYAAFEEAVTVYGNELYAYKIRENYLTLEEVDFIYEKALELFKFGQFIADKNNLILVDTKYEFGYDQNGIITLIDEIHTPDSSRYFYFDSFYFDEIS